MKREKIQKRYDVYVQGENGWDRTVFYGRLSLCTGYKKGFQDADSCGKEVRILIHDDDNPIGGTCSNEKMEKICAYLISKYGNCGS